VKEEGAEERQDLLMNVMLCLLSLYLCPKYPQGHCTDFSYRGSHHGHEVDLWLTITKNLGAEKLHHSRSPQRAS
jgi:hypothetical protein